MWSEESRSTGSIWSKPQDHREANGTVRAAAAGQCVQPSLTNREWENKKVWLKISLTTLLLMSNCERLFRSEIRNWDGAVHLHEVSSTCLFTQHELMIFSPSLHHHSDWPQSVPWPWRRSQAPQKKRFSRPGREEEHTNSRCRWFFYSWFCIPKTNQHHGLFLFFCPASSTPPSPPPPAAFLKHSTAHTFGDRPWWSRERALVLKSSQLRARPHSSCKQQ